MSSGLQFPFCVCSRPSAVTSQQMIDDCGRLAQRIADESAAADLESHCSEVEINGLKWYLSEEIEGNSYEFADPDQVRWVKDALEYLDLRALLIHHPDNPTTIRVDHEKLTRAIAVA